MIPNRVPLIVLAVAIAALAARPAAQTTTPPQLDPQGNFAATVAMAAERTEPAEQPATLVFTNRPVVVFRATVMARPPEARAAAAAVLLKELVEAMPRGRATTRAYDQGIAIGIDDRPVFLVFHADVDLLGGETLESK